MTEETQAQSLSSSEAARPRVTALVSRYHALSPTQLRSYNEENTKKDFILPLFEALGWSVADAAHVTAEEKASNGRVDYAFMVDGVVRFYVEAKPLRDDIERPEWIEQAISYGYNKGVPWVVLTNFRQFQAFNTLRRASTPADARFHNLAAEQFDGDFELLWLFSRESAGAHALDEAARKVGKTPTRLSVEKQLYDQMREWREALFRSTLLYGGDLTFGQVDEIIQRLFNRLIFIRTCEDRELEDARLRAAYNESRNRSGRKPLLPALRKVFDYYRQEYDSDLFDLHAVDNTHFDDPLLQTIVGGLFAVPGGLAEYDFAVMDADILGQVYEQYLGHVAQAARERVRKREQRAQLLGEAAPEIHLEAKREKRRDQGIYYTPRWVTDYIVRHTLGRFIEENARRPDRILDTAILDPACGSGSFLIRAYDELLAWEARRSNRPARHVFEEERVPLLRSCIFGVDMDLQAVEIARLNLLLRALGRRQLLPSLADNVMQGNSLISGTESELAVAFGTGWAEKHALNWEAEFSTVMQRGGFDVIVGNPPYIRIQRIDRAEADYFRSRFKTASGSFDISVLFVEQALKLLRPGGRLGFITSGKFLKTEYGKPLQRLLLDEATVEEVVELSGLTVFGDATTYPVILIARKGPTSRSLHYVWGGDDADASPPGLDSLPTVAVEQEAIIKGVWPPAHGADKRLMHKMEEASSPLSALAKHIFTGLQSSADDIYHLSLVRREDSGMLRVRNGKNEIQVLEPQLLKPLVAGKNIERYAIKDTGDLLLFPYAVADQKATLIPAAEMEARYPATWRYLCDHEADLRGRENGKMDHERWYGYVYPKSLGLHQCAKLAVPRLVHRLEAGYDLKGGLYLDNVDVGGIILTDGVPEHYLAVLGLLNSTLLHWYFSRRSAPFRGGFRSANRQYLETLPIATDALTKDRPALIALVEEMLALHERLAQVGDSLLAEREVILRQIDHKDREIDEAVYELYGLTDAERRLVQLKS